MAFSLLAERYVNTSLKQQQQQRQQQQKQPQEQDF